jgi:hypothetical protein
VGYGVEEQHLVHGEASPHLGGARVAGSAFQPAMASEIQQRTPRRRSRSPSKAGLDRIEQPEGKLDWGDEQRQKR